MSAPAAPPSSPPEALSTSEGGSARTIGKDEVNRQVRLPHGGRLRTLPFRPVSRVLCHGTRRVGAAGLPFVPAGAGRTRSGDPEGGGLDINMPMSLGLIWSILCGDLLTDLEYLTRPYEVNSRPDRFVLQECVEHLYGVFLHRPDAKQAKWARSPGMLRAAISPCALRNVP